MITYLVNFKEGKKLYNNVVLYADNNKSKKAYSQDAGHNKILKRVEILYKKEGVWADIPTMTFYRVKFLKKGV